MTGKRQAILDKQGNQHKYVKKHSQKEKKKKEKNKYGHNHTFSLLPSLSAIGNRGSKLLYCDEKRLLTQGTL